MRLVLVLSLATLIGGSAWSAETVPPAATTTVSPTEVPDLRAALPEAPSLIDREGVLYWDDGKGSAYRIIAADAQGATLDSEIGPIAVPRKLLAENRTDCLAVLPKLVVQAQGAKLTQVPGLTLAEGVMTGVHLRCPDLLVISDGVLRKGAAPGADRSPDRKVLDQAATALRQQLEKSRYDQLGRKTVEDILRRLPLNDDAEKFEYDEVLPSFARRVARNGWLLQTFPEEPAAKKLVNAIIAADTMQPVTVYEGPGLKLAEVRNAFGQGGWVLTTSSRTSFARPHPLPMYLSDAKSLGLTLVADLPAGANPMADADQAVAARLFHGSRAIATWSRSGGLQCELNEWRRAVPDRSPRIDSNAVSGFLPMGYYKDEEKTAKTFKIMEGVRWSVPGDWAEVNTDGTLKLLGRGSVCINTGGEKVFPEEVEEVLKLHPSVRDAVAVAVPDEKFGEVVTAVIELEPGQSVDDAEIIAHVKSKLAAFKAPKHVVVVDTIGRAPNAKVDYKRLKALATERVEAAG